MNTRTPGNPDQSETTDSFSWHVGEHQSHFDPLLDCVVSIARIFGIKTTRESLSAGLPLEDNLLTPGLLPRAAARAGMTARIVRRPLEALRPGLLPAVLLLKGKLACILLEWLPTGEARVRYPEGGESSDILSREALEALYAGVVFFVRPRFHFDARAPETGKVQSRHWFWGVVGQNWRLYRDTLIAALLINIFALAMPLFSMNVYDRVVPNRAQETLWVLALGAALMLLFDFVLRVMRAHIIDTAGKRIDVTLSSLIMERVLNLKLSQRPASVGSFAANLRAFESVREFIASAPVTALVDLPFVLIFLLVLVWISPWLILPPLVGMAIVVFASMLAQQKMQELVDVTQRASAQRNATLVESLVGLETIKFMVAEGTIQRKWERATVFLAQTGAKLKVLSSTTLNLAQSVTQLVSIAVVITGVYLLIDNQISMGGIIAASMLSGRVMGPFGQVAGLLMQYHNARAGLGAVEIHMKAETERPEDSAFLHRTRFEGRIEFKNVSFTYPGREDAALNNVSFKMRVGEKVAIIGRVGSGKSTIQRLILGLYQPSEGAVLIDGIDVRQIDPAELRRAMGFVPQDITLFYGSLKENIAFGAPFADDQMILAAADLAGVSEFADRHPSGFDMQIGERGESLSGGQRQAVGIARALLNDPPMLLLDEPSSAMDHQSEEALKARLRQFYLHKTVLLVTHRTPLLELVDRLIVIDGGQVMADGPKAQVVEALKHGRIGRAD
ncbi:type I secretion system permease/ATPase [Chitinimonas sp. BJB300]|uniref:type I secretion system permease/ATPase n=1 Tax=Chitinimonas sp. BJB300 TaxID=1559339 RepID=UPI000C11D419|nr:type I secretion system permease/ATPase [Chitinimonas sp. BJB300]PHV11386.1 type I secretion system permease/ATPase [Chitinimonas sp. BJB300]TSJ88895.1 type I secretion system permease/ATPase [Chitinimonas sp. BJB300]